MSEIVWYIGASANREVQEWAKTTSERLGLRRSSWRQLEFNAEPLPYDAEQVVIVSGDGGAGYIAQKAFEAPDPPKLLVVGAGTENGLYTSLEHAGKVHEGTIVNLQTLLDREPLEIKPLSPVVVNDEIAVVHTATVGRGAVSFADNNERMRGRVPSSMRISLAAVEAGIQQAGIRKEEPIIEAVLLYPDIKSTVVFPEQDMYSWMTHVKVPSMSLGKMVNLSRRIRSGLRKKGTMPKLPRELFEVEHVSEVVISNKGSYPLYVNGDNSHYTSDSYTFRREEERPLYVAALQVPQISRR